MELVLALLLLLSFLMSSSRHECRCGEVDTPLASASAPRQSAYTMIEVRAACQMVLDQVHECTSVSSVLRHRLAPLRDSLGLCCAQTRHATEPFPPFRASTMDGYAVDSKHGVGTFECCKEVTAGSSASSSSGESGVAQRGIVYITTGAPVPDFADAVVPVEWTEIPDPVHHPTQVKILQSVSEGTNIRPIGSDITAGQILIHAGQMIGPAEIGLLASVGMSEVHVIDRPRVGIISTGDEIVDHTTKDIPLGKIRDSNRPMLLALVAAAGAHAIDLGLVKDVVSELERTILSSLAQVDMLVLSGGVSMGTMDLLKPLLERLGKIHFGRLNMKPGKPTTFATVSLPPTHPGGTAIPKLIFGLPGNPVSSLVTSQLLVVPAIKAWQFGAAAAGITPDNHSYPVLPVRLAADIALDSTRPEYHRLHVRYDSGSNVWVGTSTGSQMSSRLLSVCAANALMLVPKASSANQGVLAKGTILNALLVGDCTMPAFQPQEAAAVALTLSPTPIKEQHHNHHQATTAAAPAAASSTSSSSSSLSSSSSSSAAASPPFILRVSVLTVSDRCSTGESTDLSGPAIQKLLSSALKNTTLTVHHTACVPDERSAITSKLIEWSDGYSIDAHSHVILTTGGTGFSPRDITPESVTSILDREASGFVFAMLQASFQATPMAALSRPVAGTRFRTIILTLPGSPKAIPEILTPILPLLPHAVKLNQATDDKHEMATQKIASNK